MCDHDPMHPVVGSPLAPDNQHWRMMLAQAEDDLAKARDAIEALTAENARLRSMLPPEPTDDRPLTEVLADLRAIVAASPEAQAGIAAYFAEQAEGRWHDGTIYNAHRAKVEADHAAAKADHPGIDMDLLGRLCREEPDADTKREVAEMMRQIKDGD